ncbi:MAG: DoxX family protein [Pseudomonadota bacterium]
MTDATQPLGDDQKTSAGGLIDRLNGLFGLIPSAIPLLVTRLALGLPFYFSGLTKWTGFLSINPTAVFLFQEEYKLRWINREDPPSLPMPEVMAYLAAYAEIILPIMLILGFGTRFAALGLLGMTIVIQFVYPDAWRGAHLPWAAMALMLMVYGGGKLSIDNLISSVRRRG